MIPLIVKLRSRSRSGEGQVRVRKVRFGPDPYSIFGFHPPHKLFIGFFFTKIESHLKFTELDIHASQACPDSLR